MDTTSARPEPPAAGTAVACYVYGVVPGDTAEPAELPGVGDPPAPVRLVRGRGSAALVSDVRTDRPLGTARDLRAHAEVLNTLAASRTAVLPFRFGAVVEDAEAVARELLGPHDEEFTATLRGLADCAQFTVRGSYEEERVLRELLAERPDISALREEIRTLPEDASGPQRLRLGELVAGAMAGLREEDTRVLLDRLGPLAIAVAGGGSEAAGTPEQAVDASFLVRHDRWSALEQAAEELARDWAGRLRLRMLGPLAPYEFVGEPV